MSDISGGSHDDGGGGSGPRPRIGLKRVYEPRESGDGTRVLVERLWPRGVSKEKAALDLWLKDVAPSPELRKWYRHEQQLWPEFVRRYRAELAENHEAVRRLEALVRDGRLTLIFATRDVERSSASVLRSYLEERLDD